MNEMTIRRPDDFHVHFRRGDMLRMAVPHTAQQFGRAMVMPNTLPKPILTAEDANDYYWEIQKALERDMYNPHFDQLMTIQIVEGTTPDVVREAKRQSFTIAGKVYPKGVTTNSHNGVSDFSRLYPIFEVMQEVDLVLSIHGQAPDSFCLDREKDFLATLIKIAKDFPRLRIVMEHISTKESVEAVKSLPPTVAATITAHHLALNLHSVLAWVGENGSEGLNPHHYCQPVLQRPEDQLALLEAAVSRNPKFFFGSDTAPHLREKKESACGCAGVFSAPVLLPVLVDVFTSASHMAGGDARLALETFTSVSGAAFYNLPLNSGEVTLVKKPWQVLQHYGGVVPLFANKVLQWQMV